MLVSSLADRAFVREKWYRSTDAWIRRIPSAVHTRQFTTTQNRRSKKGLSQLLERTSCLDVAGIRREAIHFCARSGSPAFSVTRRHNRRDHCAVSS